MDKTSFKAQVKDFVAKAGKVLKHPMTVHTGIGAGIGIGAGGLAGLGAESRLKNHPSYKKLDEPGKKRALTNLKKAKRNAVIMGGLSGGLYGAANGIDHVRWSKGYRHASGSHTSGNYSRSSPHSPAYSTEVPSWLKGVKTKAEATSKFKEVGKKHHPDMGGDAEKFKKFTEEWTAFKKTNFDKLSFVFPSFLEELASIYRETSR